MEFDIKQVIDLAKGGEPAVTTFSAPGASTVAVAFLPNAGGGSQIVDLKPLVEKWRDAPERRSGTAMANTLESFIALTNRHKDDGSAVFALVSTSSPSLTAVIDYNTTDHKPRFGKHLVKYDYPISPEWKAWLAKNGTKMDQNDFAEWIEEHIVEIGDPDGFGDCDTIEALFRCKMADPATVYTLSKGLKVNVESEVSAVTDLAGGQVQISYSEQHKDGTGQPLKIPGLFLITIPMFVGGDPVTIVARLRYRKSGSKLVWFYELWKWDVTMRLALLKDLETIREQTSLPVFEGAPEA